MKFVLNLVSLPYLMVIENAAKAIDAIRGSRNAEHKIKDLVLNILSILPLIAAAVVFLVSIISFIAGGFYGDQINMVKDGFFDALSNVWTSGNAGNFYSLWALIPVGASLITITVFAAIGLYKNGSKIRKALFTATTIILNITLSAAILLGYNVSVKDLVMDLFNFSRHSELFPIIVATGITAFVIAVIDSIILSKDSLYTGCFGNTLFCLTIAPLTCLIVENLIGVIAFVIFTVVFYVVGNFAGNALFSGEMPSAEEMDRKADMAKEEKARAKIKDRIEYLKHENEKRDKAVKGHYEKKLGCFGVDPKSCHNANVKAQKEIDYLQSQL